MDLSGINFVNFVFGLVDFKPILTLCQDFNHTGPQFRADFPPYAVMLHLIVLCGCISSNIIHIIVLDFHWVFTLSLSELLEYCGASSASRELDMQLCRL